MASLTRSLSLAALVVLLTAPSALAQTQADFDVCNQQAAAQVAASSPSASPSSSGVGGSVTSSSPGATVGGSTMTAPGSVDVNREPNASGRISGSAGSPGSNVGTVPGAATPSTSPSPTTAMPGATTDVQGMAQAGQSNPAYQQAFRDCLKARGF
jgi:hypothetical protein